MARTPNSGGPIPKPSSERRRRNKDAVETVTEPSAKGQVVAESPYEADPDWHPLAADWFHSLSRSGQARLYENSDWATAKIIAQGIHELVAAEKMSGQLFQSVMSGMTTLMVTEGDRRRLKLELARAEKADPDEDAAEDNVTDLRSRLGG